MEALLKSLAAKYGYDVAVKLLGIDKQKGNPKYAISLGGNTINPINMLKRAGINQGIKSLMGGKLGGMLGPGLLMGGALMLGRSFDPTRPGSRNYNPYLSGQIDYLSGINGMIGTNSSSGLMQYGSDSILSGQNVVSMFGTNDYLDQLNNYKNKYGKTMSKNRLDKLNKEIADYELDQVNKELKADAFKTLQNINAGNNDGDGGFDQASHDAGKTSAAAQEQSNRDYARGKFSQGGIASL